MSDTLTLPTDTASQAPAKGFTVTALVAQIIGTVVGLIPIALIALFYGLVGVVAWVATVTVTVLFIGWIGQRRHVRRNQGSAGMETKVPRGEVG